MSSSACRDRGIANLCKKLLYLVERSIFFKGQLANQRSADETLKQSPEKEILTHLTHFIWYITGSDTSNTNQFLGFELSKLQISKQQLQRIPRKLAAVSSDET